LLPQNKQTLDPNIAMASRSSSEDKPKRQQKKPTQVYESDGEESEDYAPPQRRRGQRQQQQQQQQQGGQGPLDNLQLGNVGQTAGGLVGGVTNTLGGVAGQQAQGGGGGGKSDTLRLRLDLNLDIEITLKAKIHGDLELALLYVLGFPFCSFCHLLSHFPPTIPTRNAPVSSIYVRILYIFSTVSHSSCFLPGLKVDVEKREQEILRGRQWRVGERNTMDVLEMGWFFFSWAVNTRSVLPLLCPHVAAKPSQKKNTKTRESGANSLGTEATRDRFLMEKLSRMSIVFGGQGYESCFLSSGEGVVGLGQGNTQNIVVLYYYNCIAVGLVSFVNRNFLEHLKLTCHRWRSLRLLAAVQTRCR
jgi:hypothetical protein